MSQIGRNDPCPCGSGLKYKKCCHSKGVRDSNVIAWQTAKVRQWIELDKRVSDEVSELLDEHTDAVKAILKQLDLQPDDSEAELVLGWMLHWIAFRHPIKGQTLAQVYAARRRPDEQTRQLLDAHQQSRLGLYQVTRLEPGRGVQLRDLFFDEELFLWDVGISESVQPMAAIMGWFLHLNDLHFTGALHPLMLPQGHLPPLLRTLRQAKLDKQALQGSAGRVLIGAWQATLREAFRQTGPEIANMDGDPLLWVEDRFKFPTDRKDEVSQALLGIPGASSLGRDRFGFCESREDAPLDNISVGRARLEGDCLILESNSVRRADRLRKRVDKACAGLGLVKQRRKSKPMDLTGHSGLHPSSQQEELRNHPEVQNAMQQIRQRMNERWLDLKNPMFGNRSPRELARTAAGRDRLAEVMREFADRGDPPDEIAWLKAQLGLN